MTTKETAKKAPAKKAPAKKAAAAKKAPAKKVAAAKAPAKKAPAKRTAAKAPAAVEVKKPTPMPKAPPRKPVPPAPKRLTVTPYDAKFLEAQRKMLLEQRATYLEQAESLKAEADALAAEREPGDVQFDDESGEGDTLAVERDFDLALSARARDAVDQIDEALAKVQNKTYGICVVSGQPIPKARLEAIPWARERVEYKVGDFGRR